MTHKNMLIDIASTNQQSADGGVLPKINHAKRAEGLAVIILDGDGTICECNNVCRELLCVATNQLTFQNISFFIPQLKNKVLIQENHVNPYLSFLSRIDHLFTVIDINGNSFESQLFFSEMNSHKTFLRMIVCPI